MGPFAKTLGIVLDAYGLTPAEAAQALAIAPPTLRRWLRGDSSPSLESLRRVAEFFELDWDMLLRDEYRRALEAALEDEKRRERVLSRLGTIGKAYADRRPFVPIIGRRHRPARTFTEDEGDTHSRDR